METSPGSASKEEGLRLLKAGELDEAIDVLNKVLQSRPDDPQIHTYLGVAYNEKGDRLHAIAAFEESLRLQETPKSYYNLGQIYESVHRVDEAVRQYRMAIELDPNYAPAQQALNKLHAKFEAEHPEMSQAAPPAPGAPDPILASPNTDHPQPTQAMPAQPGFPGPAEVLAPGGPPPFDDREAQQEMEVAEQRKLMMKSGLIYGMVIGAILIVLAYFALQMFLFSIPSMFATWGGMILLIVILAAIGAVYGGLIGLWVGTTCGGEGAGMQAGAAMGALTGIVLGVITMSIAVVIVTTVVCALASGVAGMIIGRLVDSSIGWD